MAAEDQAVKKVIWGVQYVLRNAGDSAPAACVKCAFDTDYAGCVDAGHACAFLPGNYWERDNEVQT